MRSRRRRLKQGLLCRNDSKIYCSIPSIWHAIISLNHISDWSDDIVILCRRYCTISFLAMRIHPRVFVVIAHKMRNYTIILILIRSLFNATLGGIKCEKTQQILSRETNFASGQLLMVLCPIWQGTSFLTVKARPCKKIIRRINVGSFYSSVEQECSDDGCVSLFFP